MLSNLPRLRFLSLQCALEQEWEPRGSSCENEEQMHFQDYVLNESGHWPECYGLSAGVAMYDVVFIGIKELFSSSHINLVTVECHALLAAVGDRSQLVTRHGSSHEESARNCLALSLLPLKVPSLSILSLC